MIDMSIGSKSMTIGEALLAPLFLVLAFLCVIAAALAHDGAFAFHTALGAIASLGAAFTIINHYYERPAQLPPAEIGGRPNYNLGPIKFAAVAAMFWGIAGFLVGLIIASQLAWPVLNFDLPWISFGRLRPLHTSAVIFAFGGNVLLASSLYVVQKTCRTRLAGFLWSLRSGQYDDLDGAAWRAIADDEPAESSNGEQDRQGDNNACPAQHKHPVEALSRRNQMRLQ